MNEFLLILAAHIFTTMAAFFFILKIKDKMTAIVETVLIFFLPFWGLLLILAFQLADRLLNLSVRKMPEKRARPEVLMLDAVRYDEDIVPLRDAYLLNDEHKKRKFFTDAIKQNVISNQRILQAAIKDSDREMSYYAVSMLTSRLENIETELFALEQEINSTSGENNLAQKREYERLLSEYLKNKNFIDHVTFSKKQAEYIELLLELIAKCPEAQSYYLKAGQALIAMRDFERAAVVCEKFAAQFANSEQAMLLYIELYKEAHDYARFKAKIEELKKSPLKLSTKALNIIRYFGEVQRHE